MDGALMEYVVNAAWQLPVLAAGAWLLVRAARPSAAAQYRIWVGVLALAAALPLLGALTDAGTRVEVSGAKTGVARVALPTAETSLSTAPVSKSPVGVVSAGVEALDAATGMDESAGTTSLQSGTTDADATQVSSRHFGKLRAGSGTPISVVERMGARWASLRLTRRIDVSRGGAEWVTGVYLLVILLGLLRIARAWSAARRLARDADADALMAGERVLAAECARRMGVREPEVRVVEDANALQGPVVVGALRPVLLCPEGFVRGLLAAGREDEAMAALCHEMAHIRRRDYAANLMCEAMAAGLKWHPVTYGVERRIRGTREMACDAMAARMMESDAEYARCLVGLAARMTTGGLMEQAGAMGLLNGNALEERVMRLMDTGKTMSVRAKVVRRVAGATAMAAAVLLAGMVHVVPARAQDAAPTEAGPKAAVVAPPAVSVKPKITFPAVVVAPVKTPAVAVMPMVGVIVPVMAMNVVPVIPKIRVVPAIHGVMAPVIAVPRIVAVPAPQTAAAPAPQAVPMPAPVPAPKVVKPYHHEAIVSRDGKLYVWENGKERELTPAERARMEKQLEDAQKKIAAETARIDSPEFREQIEKAEQEARDAERKLQSGEIQRQIAEAQKQLNSPEFRERIAEEQKSAMADMQRELNSPEFKARMAEAQKRADEAMAKLQSPEFKRQMEEAQREAVDAHEKMMSGEIQRQMAEAKKQMTAAMAKMNSPEFKEQIEKAQRDAMVAQNELETGEIQKQMADAQKELQRQLDELKAQDGKQVKPQ